MSIRRQLGSIANKIIVNLALEEGEFPNFSQYNFEKDAKLKTNYLLCKKRNFLIFSLHFFVNWEIIKYKILNWQQLETKSLEI